MAIYAAFYVLLAYIASSHLLPSRGYSRIRDTFPTARSGSISLRKDCSILPTTCCHTPNHRTASTAQLHCPRKYVCFNSTSLLAIMTATTFLELSPTDSMAKYGLSQHPDCPPLLQSPASVPQAEAFYPKTIMLSLPNSKAFPSMLPPVHTPSVPVHALSPRHSYTPNVRPRRR
jgi:hypothetical protein